MSRPSPLAVTQKKVDKKTTFGGRCFHHKNHPNHRRSSMSVYSMIVAFSNEIAAEWHQYQRVNLALTMYAIFVRRSLVLSHLAQHFPSPQPAQRQSVRHVLWHKLKRLRRFLSNARLTTGMEEVYQRLTYLALA